jgi:Organic solute transporter Ostalpha
VICLLRHQCAELSGARLTNGRPLLSQEFLICIEMFVAALAHAYAFPPSDYTDPLHPPQGMVSTCSVYGRTDITAVSAKCTFESLYCNSTLSWC